MSCAIYAVEVRADAIGAGKIVDSIIVRGKVRDCRAGTLLVGVAGSPTDTGGPISVDLRNFGFDPANTAAELAWETGPIKINVPCGDLVLVSVQCPHEVACQISIYVPVDCCPQDPATALAAQLRIDTPSGATDLTPQNINELAELSAQDCHPDGDYVLRVVNYIPGAEITWTEEDLSNGTVTELLRDVDETTLTYSLLSSGTSHKTIHVLIEYVNCNISKPLSVTFKPCGDDCASRGMITNPDGTCGNPPKNGPPPDGGGNCGGLLWAAVIALAASLLLFIFAGCFGPAQTVLVATAVVLAILYVGLLALHRLLVFLKICKKKKCQIAEVHVTVLAPIGVILLVMGLLCFFAMPWCLCWNTIALSVFTGVLGFWADRLRRCRNKDA